MTELNVILRGVVGSTAYGLATESSDVDRIGVFQVPTREFLRRYGSTELELKLGDDYEIDTEAILARWDMEGKKDSKVTLNPDIQLHELGKYIRLAAQANPTATEALWLPEYDVLTPIGEVLVANRDLFLSQRVKPRYIGYARDQLNRLLTRGDFKSKLKKRPEKHGRHCARLLIQAESILVNRVLDVRLSPEEATWCFEMGKFAAAAPEVFAEKMEHQIERLDNTPSLLPEHPDEDGIRELLLALRLLDLPF